MAEESKQPWTLVVVVLVIIGFAITNWIVVKALDSRLDEVSAKIDSMSSDLSTKFIALQEKLPAVVPAPAPAPQPDAAAAAPAPAPAPAADQAAAPPPATAPAQ